MNVIIENVKERIRNEKKCYNCQTADQAKASYLSGNAKTQKQAIVEVKGQRLLRTQIIRLTY